MNLSRQNILFLTRTMKLGGTENVILQLCEIFKPYANKIVVCSCGGVNVEKLNKMGITHYEISDITAKNPMEMIKILVTVHNVIKKEKITVIHSHHRMAAFYARFVAGKNVIKLANAHNTFYDKKKLTQIAYKGTHVIAVGEQVKKNLVEYLGIPEQQVKVIYNAIKSFDDSIIPIEELSKARQSDFLLVGNVGRLSKQKGMEYFIDAVAQVCIVCPRARFFIVGDGEDAESLKRRASQKVPEGVLTFLGYRSDIQNVMSQMDFLVLSSLWEGFPLTPIEAFSVGKTIIATAVDGTVEIVSDQENGLLVPAKDAEAIASKIQWLIVNLDKKRDMELRAKETYEKQFSFHILAERYLNYYREL